MDTSVALLVCQVSEADCPAWIEVGFTEIDAVGAGGGGGGGGGGGAAFFLQAPSSRRALNATNNRNHFSLSCFTFIPPYDPRHARGSDEVSVIYYFGLQMITFTASTRFAATNYFQLQFGCEFCPLNVNCWTLLPSANIDQICGLPERFD